MSNVDFNFSNFDFDALERSIRQAATPTKTPAEILAEQNAARLGEVAGAADVAGSFVTGEEQARVDEILAGARSGIYSAADALSALSAIETAGRAALGAGGADTADEVTIPTPGREFDEDAYSRLTALLGRIGLEGLTSNIRELVAKGITDSDAILFELRGTDKYKERFAANAARTNPNRPGGPLPELSPATYVALENSYRDTMRAAGLPAGFYDQSSDFQKLIENDVSVSELNTRVQQGFVMVRDADPEVKRQMQRLYGVDENGLAAYFLDPERATPILTRQAQAAKISARAREQAGFTLLAQTAEDLVARGYSPEEAQTAFQRAGQLAGLYQEMGGEEMLTEQQKIGAAFGFDVQAQQALERRRAQRVAEFAGGGAFARTTGATSGTVETGVGTAQ
jgi:hypothetical protein